jgi:hypothetical protein
LRTDAGARLLPRGEVPANVVVGIIIGSLYALIALGHPHL